MKVALVHYWLVGMRGGEKVFEELCEMYPQADIFTLVIDRSAVSETILKHKITTSFLQKIGGRRHYQKMLALMPFALEAFDLTDYDLVISSEAGPAKGIITRPDSLHVCYCHSPMRYIWDLYPQYRASAGWLARVIMSCTTPFLRQWDVTTSARVDHFIANSAYVAKRIEKFYRRGSTVIHPPVDVDRFSISAKRGDYYLCAGQITPYKRIDLAVEACTRLGRRLLVIGSGGNGELRQKAGPTIEFIGAVDDATLADYFAGCRALLYPGVEDFGIVPLEVMASGRPVIAFGRGGAAETVIPHQTGLLFNAQTVDAMAACIKEFEDIEATFDQQAIQAHAHSFNKARFRAQMNTFLTEVSTEIAVVK